MILITGLDGSGKSTVLNRFEDKLINEITVLRVPTIDSEKFKNNDILYKQSEFINYLGKRADKERIPFLKIIAMFGSMLLFSKLSKELGRNGKQIYCERHPLIDTSVYAKIYLEFMNPANLDMKIVKEIEANYGENLNSIVGELGLIVRRTDKGVIYDLLSFLYDWFSVKENSSFERLKVLFPVELPSMIYFLDAPSDILIKRIAHRLTQEYHETEKFLAKMRPIYLNIFERISVPCKIINTSVSAEVESFMRNILRNHN